MFQFQIEIELIDFLHNVITNVLVNHKKFQHDMLRQFFT